MQQANLTPHTYYLTQKPTFYLVAIPELPFFMVSKNKKIQET